MDAFLFTLMVLACWRITHLFSEEDGPFDIIFKLRTFAGTGFFGSLLDCFYCVSVWVAFPFEIFAGNIWWEKVLYWWAISGAACLFEQATTNRKNSAGDINDYKED